MGILRADRFSPTIFLGLGGSGSRVVNMISGKIKRHPNYPQFRELIHSVCIDTNKADLGAMKSVPDSNRFLVSAFDRRSYVERKRGRQELDEDKLLTQWVHPDYGFREAQGAGAGQIRVESRLGIFYNLEDDRAGILRAFRRILDTATRPDNPFRDNEDRVVNVMIYASVAGGTGSGGFLPMAYLLQDLVKDHGWGRANVVGTLLLPSLFTSDVENALMPDINANGYAALKELEYCTKLGYERGIKEIEFHYDPTKRERIKIRNRPFALCYLVDKPAELSVERYSNAIADSALSADVLAHHRRPGRRVRQLRQAPEVARARALLGALRQLRRGGAGASARGHPALRGASLRQPRAGDLSGLGHRRGVPGALRRSEVPAPGQGRTRADRRRQVQRLCRTPGPAGA